MKTIGKLIGAFVGIALLLALFSILSWPVLVLSGIGLWYYTKKDPNPKFQKIALVALVFSFFGVVLGFTDGSADNPEQEKAKTEEIAVKESEESKEKKKS